MWSTNGDDEFLKDLDVVSEIWESKKVKNNEPFHLQHNIPQIRKRSNLIDESDEEDEKDNLDEIYADENDPERIAYEIEQQIAEATGNMHSNKVLTDYWQTTDKQKTTQKSKISDSDNEQKNSGFIVQSNFDIEKLVPIGNKKVDDAKNNKKSVLVAQSKTVLEKSNPLENKVVNNIPKTTGLYKTKKKSVADAIQTSLKFKNMSEPAQEVSPKKNADTASPVRKKENIMVLPNFMGVPRKVLTSETVPSNNQPSNRFSLPIHGDGYKDYYSGAKLADYSEEEDFTVRQNGDWMSSVYGESSDTNSYKSDRYGYRDDFSFTSTSSSGSSKKILNIKSDIDFPPLS